MRKQVIIPTLFLFSLFSVILFGCKKSTETPNNTSERPKNTTDSVNRTLPVLVNSTVTNITATRATISAEITLDGGYQITEQGVCYDTMPNPTTAQKKLKSDSVKLGAFSLQLKGLKPNRKYYARAYATNEKGTGYSNEVTFFIESVKIGDLYGGGIVFYIDATTHHGLISALPGRNHATLWGCSDISVPGLKTEIGTGQANTKAIIAACSSADNAAKWCDDLVENGYKDWFLPSRDELAEMYKHRDKIGFNSITRWSSSEAGSNAAWAQSFGTDGGLGPVKIDKASVLGVRAIRAF